MGTLILGNLRFGESLTFRIIEFHSSASDTNSFRFEVDFTLSRQSRPILKWLSCLDCQK